MRIIVLILMLFIAILPVELKYNITLLLTIFWLIYTVCVCIKIIKQKDKKIIVKDISSTIPNDNFVSHIRYLYSRKVDNKVLISTIFELLVKKSISLKRINMNEYYFIDNKVPEEVLSKNEEFVKKILFKEIGNTECVSLDAIKKAFTKNSGYMYIIYKNWRETFEYEVVNEKYFKSTRVIIDNTMFYFVVSMIIAVYNILYTKLVIAFFAIFFITSFLIKKVNDLTNIEEEAKDEYISWLSFRNYILSGNLDEKNIEVLERYMLYAYVLDAYDSFKKSLNNMYYSNKDVFNDSVILSIANVGILDYIDKIIDKSMNTCKYKSILLFSKNKGRRV